MLNIRVLANYKGVFFIFAVTIKRNIINLLLITMKKQITTQKIKNSRFFIFAFFLLGLSSIIWGQTTIHQESFESAPNGVATDYFADTEFGGNDVNDYWQRIDVTGNGKNQINTGVTGADGLKMYAGEDIDGATPTPKVLTIVDTNVVGYSNIQVKVAVGSGEQNKYDTGDYIKIFVKKDGGAEELVGAFYGYDHTNGDGTNGRMYQDVDLNGTTSNDSASPMLSKALQDFTFNISGSFNNLQVIVKMTTNSGAEILMVDNVRIVGTAIPLNATDSYVATPSAIYNIPGGNISSIADTPAEAVDVFSFDINDSGLVDTLPTKVTKIRIKPGTSNTGDWAQFIQGVVVKDAFTSNIITPTSVSITSNFIDLTFNSGDIIAADNDDQVITLAVYLNTSNILDNKVLSFKVDDTNHGFLADPSGSTFATTFPNGPVVSNDFTVQVNATEMQFVQQPTDVIINTIMNPAVTVAYTDENGNKDRDINGAGITATLSTNGSSFDPSVTTTTSPVNGLVVFSDIKYIIIDTGVTLTVTSNSNSVTSTSFNVTAPKCNITTGIIIGMQDFEDIPTAPVLPYTGQNVSSSSGDGVDPTAPMYVSGSKGVQVNNATGILTFGPVDTSKYENISFTISLASFSNPSGNGADSGDTVLIEIFDGNTYSEELKVLGFGNSRWSFTSGTATAQAFYDGDNTSVDFQPSSGGYQTTEGYSTLIVNNLPNISNLQIKITAINNSTNEFWVFDDAILKGDQKEYTVWDNATQTWSNGVPDEYKKAYFDSDYDTGANGDINACACEVANGVTVKVGTNEFLEVGNNFINNGHVLVANSGSIVQLNDNVTILGSNFNIERQTTPYRMYDYTYWSSPVEDADLNVVFANNPQDRIYAFDTSAFNDDSPQDSFDDENDDWQQVAGLMTPGKGYIVMGQGAQFPVPNPIPTTTQQQAVNFIGKINNGTISVPVSLDNSTTDTFTNQNLIGNPYPSAIDARLFLEQNNNLSGTLYFWTHNDQISSANPGPDTYNFTNDSYVTYTAGTGGAQGNCGGCTIPTDFIASGQAFFADVDDASVPVVFKNNMRVTNNNDNFYRTPQNEKNRIWLNMTTNTNDFRQILIGFFDNATDNYDNYFDGRRLENGNHFDFYSLIGNEKFAVQGVPTLVDQKTIPVGVEVPVDAQLTFSIDHFEGDLNQVNVYLKDNVLNVIHDLKQSNYVIYMTQGEYPNRFEIIFSRSALATNEQTIATTTNLIVANNNNGILVKLLNGKMKNVQVYDVIGKLITNKNVQTNEVNLNSNYLSGTVYFVKVTLENDEVLTKKIIKM